MAPKERPALGKPRITKDNKRVQRGYIRVKKKAKKKSKQRQWYWDNTDKTPNQLRSEFIKLLDEERTEQFYQKYIEQNTRLVPHEFVQNHGIHFELVLRKLSFGADYKSDFVYLSKSSDDWNCVLIEIEKPGSRFFKDGSNELHPDFSKALQQISSWRAWFSSSHNKTSFADNTIGLIRTPLRRNPIHPKYVLVHGRRPEYGRNAIRRQLIAAQEREDFKILTYDSLAENLQSKHDLYLGVRHNEYIDIVSDVFRGESIFCWMEPDQIQIGTRLKASALEFRDQWCHVTLEDDDKFSMDRALRKIRLRSK
jgi:hypothetical protein